MYSVREDVSRSGCTLAAVKLYSGERGGEDAAKVTPRCCHARMVGIACTVRPPKKLRLYAVR